MPGVLCQGTASRNSLGALPGLTSSRVTPYPVPSDPSEGDFSSSSGLSAMTQGDRDASSSGECPSTRPQDVGGSDRDDEWLGRALTSTRVASLSRSDLVGRRFSLEPPPPPMRSRSQSQPPAMPHSAPPGTGEYLAEVALQNILASCVLPTIHISKDASQGDSNVEDGHQTLKPCSSLEATKSPSKLKGLPGDHAPSYKHSSLPVQECNDLPTDLSDTVESDQGKDKVPGSCKEVVVCPNVQSHHVGQEIANTVYGLPIDVLFTLLFTNSKFMLDLHTARKTSDLNASDWKSDSKNQKIRQVTYTLTLPTSSFGPKVSHVTETQVISSFSKPSEIYTIDIVASNKGIPYAEFFNVSNHWCLTRESSTETRITLYSQVHYKKEVWGFMRNLIDKHSLQGVKSFMSDLNTSLLLEVDRANLKRTKKRRRRGGSKGADIADPLHQLPAPGIIINDIHKATQIPSRKMVLPSASMEVDSPSTKGTVKSTVLLFLCLLLGINAFLYYRLYDLEERVVNNVSFKTFGPESPVYKFSEMAGTEGVAEEWVRILRQQESLHAEELDRWKKAVTEAADYLRKAEESLRNLHASIPSQQASKMQSLLHQLQILQQMQEQKTTPTPPSPPPGVKPPDGGGGGMTQGDRQSRSPQGNVEL